MIGLQEETVMPFWIPTVSHVGLAFRFESSNELALPHFILSVSSFSHQDLVVLFSFLLPSVFPTLIEVKDVGGTFLEFGFL